MDSTWTQQQQIQQLQVVLCALKTLKIINPQTVSTEKYNKFGKIEWIIKWFKIHLFVNYSIEEWKLKYNNRKLVLLFNLK